MTTLSDLYVVIVVYKVAYQECSSFISILNSLQNTKGKLNLLIYDNSPLSNNEKYTGNINLTYIHNNLNPGVSKAYNTGAEIANKINCKYLLFLDQDSRFDSGFLRTVIRTLNISTGKKMFAPFVIQRNSDVLLSPSKYKNFRGSIMELPDSAKQLSLTGHSIINSGMVINIDLFNQVGGFNEKINLDFSDHEFVCRVSKKIGVISIIPTKIYHSLSSMEAVDLKSSLFRFNSYIEGGRIFAENIGRKPLFYYTAFGRCALLTIRTKSFAFSKLLIRSLFKW